MRLLNPIILLTVIFFLIAATGLAQQRETAGLTDFPVPAWPADGKVPPELKDKYVFIDLARNEYVLAYPSKLGTPDFEKDPGEMRIARFELQRGVEPAINVAVTALGQKYKYDYTVRNAPNARQAIDSWNIVIPENSSALTHHPEKWGSVVQKERKLQMKKPDWIKGGSSAFWFILSQDDVISAGGSKGGFVLESDLLPGFTLAYFRKALAFMGPSTATVPKPVLEQVDALLKLEYNSKTLAAIGPKFPAGTAGQVIVADFVEGIDLLTRTGELDPNSEFVKSVTAELKAGVPTRIAAQPRNETETQIVNALKVSLRLN
jgi:hypothetical protein